MCCHDKCTCTHPRPDPKTFTPEQIRKCHGETDKHPYESQARET
jgi:hypothetical protein